MSSLHRFFGVEFTGHRHDVPVPYVKQIEGMDIEHFNKTGYEHGCSIVTPGCKSTLSESDLGEPLNMSVMNKVFLSFSETPLFQALENGVILNDAYASRFIEDFIAGFEYALHIQTQLQEAKNACQAAFHNAVHLGFDAVSLNDFGSQVEGALGEGLITFKVLPTEAEPEETKVEDKFITMSAKELLINAHTLSFGHDFGPFRFEGTVNSYTIDMQKLAGQLEEKPFVRSLLLVLVNHIGACIENKMFERYRNEQVNQVIAALKDPENKHCIIRSVYTVNKQ